MIGINQTVTCSLEAKNILEFIFRYDKEMPFCTYFPKLKIPLGVSNH